MANWTKLTDKETALVLEYLQNLNQVKSYQKIHGCSYNTAVKSAYLVFNREHVKELIQEVLAERTIEPSELLDRYKEIISGKAGEYLTTSGGLNYEKLVKDGKAYLVKRIKPSRYGTEIEFVDYQRALETMTRIMGLQENKVSLSINESTLEDKLNTLREKIDKSN